jgi:hypothetical protein
MPLPVSSVKTWVRSLSIRLPIPDSLPRKESDFLGGRHIKSPPQGQFTEGVGVSQIKYDDVSLFPLSVRGPGAGKMSEKKNKKKRAAEGDRRLDFCLKSFYDSHDYPSFMQTLVS